MYTLLFTEDRIRNLGVFHGTKGTGKYPEQGTSKMWCGCAGKLKGAAIDRLRQGTQSSNHAPPVGQIQNAINDIIEEFVLFVNQEYPLKKAAGDTSGPVTVAPPVHVPDREPERLKILKDRKELKILYVSENLSRNAIAHRLKVSHSAVGEALKRFGIVKKEKPRSRHPGQIPFGWDWNDIKLVKNQKEQKTIRWIGQMEKTGKSLREIAKVLNESNVPAKNGGVWQANTVRVLLNRQ